MGGRNSQRLTKLFEHFVALVQDEVLDFGGIENLISDEGVETAGGGDHNVRALGLVSESVGVLRHRSATEERVDADVWHVLRETRVLVLNLVCELARVAKNNDRDLAVDRLELLQRCEHENSRLSVTRLGLAQNVHAEHGLRDTLLLDCIISMLAIFTNLTQRIITHPQTGARNRGR